MRGHCLFHMKRLLLKKLLPIINQDSQKVEKFLKFFNLAPDLGFSLRIREFSESDISINAIEHRSLLPMPSLPWGH